MSCFFRLIVPTAFVLSTMAAPPVYAAEDELESRAGNWCEKFERDLHALERHVEEKAGLVEEKFQEWLKALPRYALPHINENGDIIIRRKSNAAPSAPLRTTLGAPARLPDIHT